VSHNRNSKIKNRAETKTSLGKWIILAADPADGQDQASSVAVVEVMENPVGGALGILAGDTVYTYRPFIRQWRRKTAHLPGLLYYRDPRNGMAPPFFRSPVDFSFLVFTPTDLFHAERCRRQ